MRGAAAFIKKVNRAFITLYNRHIDSIECRDDIQSASALINTFSFIVHSYGIGSCWVAHLPNKNEIKRLLGIYRYYDPIALITFGFYPSRVKFIPWKNETNSSISTNKFDLPKLAFSKEKNIFVRKLFRWTYYKIPAFIKKKIRKYSLPYEKKFYFGVYD